MFATARTNPGLAEIVELVAAELESLEPGVLSGDDAARAVGLFARLERLAAAGRTLVAGRVAECGTWKRSGERSVVHWLARQSGSTVSDAKSVISTARRLPECSATEGALRSGELSGPQAAAIADAAADNPDLEDELLRRARLEPLDGLRRHARAVGVADGTVSDRQRHLALRARRSLRHWTDTDGMGCTLARLAPVEHAELVATLASFRDTAFRNARREGRREPYEAYAADGLVEMARAATRGVPDDGAGAESGCEPQARHLSLGSGPAQAHPATEVPEAPHRLDGAGTGGRVGDSGPQRPRRTGSADSTVIVRIDHEALRRGHARQGETCEIAGVGAVPVASVREMIESGDPFLAAVVTRGVDVCTAAHLGRRPSAHQRTALWWRDPECCVEGCTSTVHLEADHRVGWAVTGRTHVPELDRLCPHHHRLKTFEGWGLEEGTGKRRMHPPGGRPGPNVPDPGCPVAGAPRGR